MFFKEDTCSTYENKEHELPTATDPIIIVVPKSAARVADTVSTHVPNRHDLDGMERNIFLLQMPGLKS